MKTKLITALRIAANALENNTFHYNWKRMEQCNCGVVACALLGLSATELDEHLEEISPPFQVNWAMMAGMMCPVTGVATDVIFGKLQQCGMTALDIVQLEELSNPRVLARCDFGSRRKTTGKLWWKKTTEEPILVSYDYKQHVILYLRAWADLLTEETADDAPERVHTSATPNPTP